MTERLMLPVLPLREVVLFPGVTAPIGAGRPGTLRAIEAALATPGPPDLRRLAARERRAGGCRRPLHDRHHRPDRPDAARPGRHAAAAAWGAARDRNALRRQRGLPPGGGTRGRGDDARSSPEDPAFVALYKEARTRAAELGQKSGLPEEVVQQVLAGVDEPGRFADLVAGLPRHQSRPAPGPAGDAVRRGAAAPGAGPRPAADRRPRRAGRHQVAGPGGARRAPARDVPARAAEGDPSRARRGGRRG